MSKVQAISINDRGTFDLNATYRMFDKVTGPDEKEYVLLVGSMAGRHTGDRNVWFPIEDLEPDVDYAVQLDANTTAILEKTGYGIFAGLGVTAQETPDMTVAVATGVAYRADGTRQAPAAVASQTITAADATNARIDLMYLSSAGEVTYLEGTPDASPAAPATPAGGISLAEIAVAANATTVAAENITDKRKRYFYIA